MTSIHLVTLLTAFIALTVPTVLDERGGDELQRAAVKARSKGVDSAFLDKMMAAPDAGFVAKTVRINVTNYAYTPDYSGHYNATSVREVKSFIAEHDSLLSAVEKQRKVPKEIIASILWIESRCGTITGTYHVPSVYLSLVLADDDAYVQQSLDRVLEKQDLDSAQTDSVRTLIVKRAERKSRWAIKELKALQEIDQRGVMDVSRLNGSWAGAFGYSQFLPSSYRTWAVDGDGDGTIDLYHLPDAAHSIANYLRDNGWTTKRSKQRKAVHHYNNSDAYVDAVFTLASKVN